MKNKLAYLGFLGFLGIFGLWSGAYAFVPFVLCFFFFTYANMECDELFILNLRRAGLWSATASLILQGILLCFTVWRNMTQAPVDMELSAYETLVLTAAAGDTVTLPGFFFLSMHLLIAYFSIIFMLSLCIFMFSLLYFSKREKRAVEE